MTRWFFGKVLGQQRRRLKPACGRQGCATRKATRKKGFAASHRASQGVQIGEQIAELFVGQGVAGGGHHTAAVDDGSFNEAVVGGQSAGHVFFLEQMFETRPLQSARGIRRVAGGAAKVVDAASSRLLRVEAKLGIGLCGFVRPAASKKGQKNAGQKGQNAPGQLE